MLNQGRRGMERSLTIAIEDSARSARQSRHFAAEMNRATRVNVQLLMVSYHHNLFHVMVLTRCRRPLH